MKLPWRTHCNCKSVSLLTSTTSSRRHRLAGTVGNDVEASRAPDRVDDLLRRLRRKERIFLSDEHEDRFLVFRRRYIRLVCKKMNVTYAA